MSGIVAPNWQSTYRPHREGRMCVQRARIMRAACPPAAADAASPSPAKRNGKSRRGQPWRLFRFDTEITLRQRQRHPIISDVRRIRPVLERSLWLEVRFAIGRTLRRAPHLRPKRMLGVAAFEWPDCKGPLLSGPGHQAPGPSLFGMHSAGRLRGKGTLPVL